MVRHTIKILQQMLQDFYSVSDHFGTLCIKGLMMKFMVELYSNHFLAIRDVLIVVLWYNIDWIWFQADLKRKLGEKRK